MRTYFNLNHQLLSINNNTIHLFNQNKIKRNTLSPIISKNIIQKIFLNNSFRYFKSNNFIKLQFKNFCSWKRIDIPFNRIEINFCRSSGPGGQNVNKLNSKVEYRFNIENADWLPKETKERLKEMHSNKINNEGFFILTCQEYRTQSQNKKEAQKKLQEIIDIASIPKKERIIVPFEETPKMEERRIKEKKIRSEVKKMRNNHRDF